MVFNIKAKVYTTLDGAYIWEGHAVYHRDGKKYVETQDSFESWDRDKAIRYGMASLKTVCEGIAKRYDEFAEYSGKEALDEYQAALERSHEYKEIMQALSAVPFEPVVL